MDIHAFLIKAFSGAALPMILIYGLVWIWQGLQMKILPSSAKPSKASASAEFSLNLKLLHTHPTPPHPRKSSNSAGSEHSFSI